ncbi:MAG: hypothetical protein PHC94_14600 [Methylobacter sp.]|nr:hypothetical protein [Methylobacter sp.]
MADGIAALHKLIIQGIISWIVCFRAGPVNRQCSNQEVLVVLIYALRRIK